MLSSKVPWYGILLVPRMVYQFDLDLEVSDSLGEGEGGRMLFLTQVPSWSTGDGRFFIAIHPRWGG